MRHFDLRTDKFVRAVRNIERRAERQEEVKLVKGFVPNKVLDDLDTSQNQLLFGRRGVGKTHTMKAYLAKKVNEGELCHYIDCTSFGSGLGADGSSKNVAIRFFSKFLSVLANGLLDDATLAEYPVSRLHDALEAHLFRLSALAERDIGEDSFRYHEIATTITAFLDDLDTLSLIVLLDEWAQIPLNAQPYFGEFLKRAFFSNPRVTVKIGVVDYAYKLSARDNDYVIGLERSADIFTDVRMDSYFVWDEDKQFVEDFFAEVLFNHLALEVGIEVDSELPGQKVAVILDDVFTQRRVLSELCRAAEGNARDFLVIFGRAFARYKQQAVHDKIGVDDIYNAAISWYRSDKATNISAEQPLEQFLEHLVHSIIRDKKSRTFMVPSQAREHPLLKRLFSARILHPLNLEWSHPDRPGERYNLITMDFGSYASFKGTRNEPNQQLFWETRSPEASQVEDLVPLDDRRSIRRIVVATDTLDRFWAMLAKEGPLSL